MKINIGKSSTDVYHVLIMSYAQSPFRDFDSNPRILNDFDEQNSHLILMQNISYFVTYERPTGFYTNNDISEFVYTMEDHKGPSKLTN